MRIAIIHDFLYVFGGAERVLKGIIDCFPDADIHCLFDVMSDADKQRVGYKTSKVSFLQRMPQIHKRHRLYLPLMPIAIEQFDLSGYDIVISSSAAVAKGVIVGPDTLHIAYIHSPMRYAWDLQHQYLKESKKDKGIKGVIARSLLHGMRIWDTRTAFGPDVMVANSHYIKRRIRKAYGRTATVIYPPVHIPSDDVLIAPKKDYFLAASRMVPYKNLHIIAEAFTKLLPNQQLIIAGDGPDFRAIKALSGSNVSMVGFVSDAELSKLMTEAKAFVFAGEEDFGIVLVEAQAHGTPVIALGRGGATETVKSRMPNPTGLFFPKAIPVDIAKAVSDFLNTQELYTAGSCRANALLFSEQRFINEFSTFVAQQFDFFRNSVNMSQNESH